MPTVGILYTQPWVVVYIRLVLATGRVYMKMEEDPNYFFKETAFLKLFLSFLNDKKEDEEQLEEI